MGRVATLAVAVSLLAAFATILLAAQNRSRSELEDRFVMRSMLGARFTEAYVAELMSRERAQARHVFVRGRPSARRFEDAVRALDLQAAVLVDGRGRLVFVWPRRPELVGSPIADKYAHLRRALSGQPSVSQVVRSAAKGVPAVAFAIPLETPTGKRAVFSGALTLATSPLGAYLRNALPIRGGRAYLFDQSGVAVAASTSERVEAADAAAFASRRADFGVYETDERRFFAAERVNGTPWRVVVTVPESALLAPVSGLGRWAPWLVFAGFALMFLAVLILFVRLLAKGTDLSSANERLGEMARTDALTGVLNRRGFDERLALEVARSRRSASSFALLVGDLDHFKRLNDRHGHQAGDDVLRRVGAILRGSVRLVDAVARTGGEEFAALLPDTDEKGARILAERMRNLVERSFYDEPAPITISFGVASFDHEIRTADHLSAAADAALYAAKNAGRNTTKVHRRSRTNKAVTPAPA